MRPRTVVNVSAALLVVAWLVGALAGYAWTWLPLVASCLFLLTGYSTYNDQRQPVTTRTVHTPAPAVTYIGGGQPAAWRDDILRRDPQAYPLTKRAVWPNQAGAPE